MIGITTQRVVEIVFGFGEAHVTNFLHRLSYQICNVTFDSRKLVVGQFQYANERGTNNDHRGIRTVEIFHVLCPKVFADLKTDIWFRLIQNAIPVKRNIYTGEC